MHPVRRRRLLVALLVILGSASGSGLMLYALGDNIDLFYVPGQVSGGEVALGQRLRVGGMVLPGSLARVGDGLDVRCVMGDERGRVSVHYRGLLPDLFAEGEFAVVAGTLQPGGVLRAHRVLAKHDENYRPPPPRS